MDYQVSTIEEAPRVLNIPTKFKSQKFVAYGQGEYGEYEWATFKTNAYAKAWCAMMRRQREERVTFHDLLGGK